MGTTSLASLPVLLRCSTTTLGFTYLEDSKAGVHRLGLMCPSGLPSTTTAETDDNATYVGALMGGTVKASGQHNVAKQGECKATPAEGRGLVFIIDFVGHMTLLS